MKFIIRCLIFSGGKGIPTTIFANIFGSDNITLLEEARKLLISLGIELRENALQNIAYIVPSNDFFIQLNNYNLIKKFQVLTKNQKEILSRILSIFISEGKDHPISKEKIRIELKDKYGIDYSNRDLESLEKLGFIRIQGKKFLDIGWRLQNSPELKAFTEFFIKNIEEVEIELKNEKSETNQTDN